MSVWELAKWTNVFCGVLAPSGIHRGAQTAPPEVQHIYSNTRQQTHIYSPWMVHLFISSLDLPFFSRSGLCSSSAAMTPGWSTAADGPKWRASTWKKCSWSCRPLSCRPAAASLRPSSEMIRCFFCHKYSIKQWRNRETFEHFPQRQDCLCKFFFFLFFLDSVRHQNAFNKMKPGRKFRLISLIFKKYQSGGGTTRIV